MKMVVCRVVAPCSLVEVYRRFRGACCLHHRRHGGKTQKTSIFTLAAVRISNRTGIIDLSCWPLKFNIILKWGFIQGTLSFEIFWVQFTGVGHPSPPHLDTGFCSHAIYQLNGKDLILLVAQILMWHAENNVRILFPALLSPRYTVF
jgi:hypothetical protein